MTTKIKRREMLALMSKTAAAGLLLPAVGYPQTLEARQGVVIGSVRRGYRSRYYCQWW